jgi:hypothetical protein
MAGTRSMTPHSTAFFSDKLGTVSALLTVLDALAAIARFRRCTSSFVISSSRFCPRNGSR